MGALLSFALGVVGATSVALVAIAIAATWCAGFYQERARRAAAALRRGGRLHGGPVAIEGVVRPLDGRAGGRLVTSTRTQVLVASDAWRDTGVTVTGWPFGVVVASGEEIEVDPANLELHGYGERIGGRYFAVDRSLSVCRDLEAHVASGERVWASGVLSRRPSRGAGAYRSANLRRVLRPPRGGAVLLSPTSPVRRWEALANAHRSGVYAAGIALAAVHAFVFQGIDRALLRHASVGRLLFDPESQVGLLGAGLFAVLLAVGAWRRQVVRAEQSG